MQPLGRKPNSYNFIDNHPQKGLINWWEDIHGDRKKGARLQSKREIKLELKALTPKSAAVGRY